MMLLVLDKNARERLAALREAAVADVVDIVQAQAAVKTPAGVAAHIARMRRHSLDIPGPQQWFVTYTVETGHSLGTVRHLSVSLDDGQHLPPMAGVHMIAAELGFIMDGQPLFGWLEVLLNEGRAVNLAQPVLMAQAGRA